MPVHSVERLVDGNGDETGLTFDMGDGRVWTVNYAEIPGNSWNQNRLNKFMERAQEEVDVRVPLTDLPTDDPDRLSDPGLPGLFWDGGDLVSRQCVISNVAWDGVRLTWELERT